MYRIYIKLLFLLPIPVAVGCISIAGDPANIFSSQYENRISQILLAGKNATGVSNFDERLLQRRYAKGNLERKDLLVIGSSRSMQIHSGLFSNKTIYNAGVSGAALEDYIGIYQMYRNSPMKPATVIIGLDPWILNRNNGERSWKSINEEVDALTNELLGNKSGMKFSILTLTRYRKYFEAFSPDYFRKSLKSLIHKNKSVLRATTITSGNMDTILVDGTRSYNLKFVSRSKKEVDSDAISYTEAKPVYLLGNFQELDPTYRVKLERLIKLIQNDNVEIRFFLPPYHPETYKRLLSNEQFKIIENAEDYFRTLAKNNQITVYGSYNPSRFNLDSNDFYDGMHPRRESMPRLFMSSDLPVKNTPNR